MTRGDIVSVADPADGDSAGETRAAVIVQSDSFDAHHSVTVCPITGRVMGLHLFRVPVPADVATGLSKPGEVSIDQVQTVWRHRIGRPIGRVSDEVMFSVDSALRRWLQL